MGDAKPGVGKPFLPWPRVHAGIHVLCRRVPESLPEHPEPIAEGAGATPEPPGSMWRGASRHPHPPQHPRHARDGSWFGRDLRVVDASIALAQATPSDRARPIRHREAGSSYQGCRR